MAESWLEVAGRIIAEQRARSAAYNAWWHPVPAVVPCECEPDVPLRRLTPRPSLDDSNQGERLVYLMPGGRCVAWDGQRWATVPAGDGETDGAERVPSSDVWLTLRVADEWARATKLWRWTGEAWERADEAVAKRFWPGLVHVDDTAEAWAGLFRELADKPDVCLVRGVSARGGAPVRRALRVDNEDGGAWQGQHPTGRRVVLLDFDKVPAAELLTGWPGASRWPSVDEAAALVRRVLAWALPGRFWGAAAAYRWSASTGVPGGERGAYGWTRPSCHVALVLDRPVCDESLREWFRASVKVDECLAGSVHQAYLADPLFEGAPSPWPADFPRVGVLDGHAATEAPAALLDGEAWQTKDDEAKAAARVAAADGRWAARLAELRGAVSGGHAEREEERRRRWAAAALTGMAGDVLAAGQGDRHATLRGAAVRAGGLVAGRVLDEADVWLALTTAWASATSGENRAKEGAELIRSGLALGMSTPKTWDEVRRDER